MACRHEYTLHTYQCMGYVHFCKPHNVNYNYFRKR